MKVPVFLSRPTPHLSSQEDFINLLKEELSKRGLDPVTMGRGSGYDYDAPLVGIRRLLTHTCGLVSVAFRRSHAANLTIYAGANLAGMKEQVRKDAWFTSPYCQIEPAMAFQLGLPILVLREKGVVDEGVLERGITGLYLPEFSLEDSSCFISGQECSTLLDRWSSYVHATYNRRGDPPRLFDQR